MYIFTGTEEVKSQNVQTNEGRGSKVSEMENDGWSKYGAIEKPGSFLILFIQNQFLREMQ